MKRILLIFALLAFTGVSFGQISLKKLDKKVKKEVEKRVDKNIDKGIDKTLDKAEEEAGKAVTGQNEEKAAESESDEVKNNTPQSAEGNPDVQKGVVEWNKYDFVPGDIIIFEDDLSSEKNGEFPSKWDLTKGTIENAIMDGENVIIFRKCNVNGGGGIVPLIKNSDKDYLPDEFTIEFDAFFEIKNCSYKLSFLDFKNQKKLDNSANINSKYLRFQQNSIDGASIEETWFPGTSFNTKNISPSWRHISISFNKRALKAYLDEARIVNIPNLGYNPTGVTLGFHNPSGKPVGYVKNIKIAQGAVPLYDKFLTDGKIITTGIKFDINKATLKSESMGVINDIFKIMEENKNINFSVEGHTDNTGEENRNQILSEERAQTVMNQLITMGISKERLKYKGFGESIPLQENVTPEGRANNRRVEFVKF